MAARNMSARRFAELAEQPAKADYDPEDLTGDSEEDESGSEVFEDDVAGTEHYVSVGKSKLRQKEAVSLGPQYRGARVSREALEESSGEIADSADEDDDARPESEEYDDPEAADLEADHDSEDAEIDSDEAFGESDEEKYKDFVFSGSSKAMNGKRTKRPIAADFMSSSDDDALSLRGEEDLDSSDDQNVRDGDADKMEEDAGARRSKSQQNGTLPDMDSDDDSQGEDEDDDDQEEDDDEEESEGDGDTSQDSEVSEGEPSQDREVQSELRNLFKDDRRAVMDPISKAAKAEAEKGFAVRQQRRSLDSLLNIRIRLQKALVAVNSLSVVPNDQEGAEQAYQTAEEAALKLWNTIDGFRDLLVVDPLAKADRKRKRAEADLDWTDQRLWDAMEEVEGERGPLRRKTLDKWSTKIQRPTGEASTQHRTGGASRKFTVTQSRPLSSVLDDQLVSAERLISRTRKPRSCAPLQVAKKINEDADIFDDGDFYSLLLKELVEQRSTDSSAPGSSVTMVRWAALKEAKTTKQVDRRASKGRKLRYNVHEKLQNFMVPEDRRTWEPHAIDNFFGTLFGQKLELRENESDEEMGGADAEEEGLRLFRN